MEVNQTIICHLYPVTNQVPFLKHVLLYNNKDRSQSHQEITPVGQLSTTPLTRKLI